MSQQDHYTLSRGTCKTYLNLVVVHFAHNSQNRVVSLPRNFVLAYTYSTMRGKPPNSLVLS